MKRGVNITGAIMAAALLAACSAAETDAASPPATPPATPPKPAPASASSPAGFAPAVFKDNAARGEQVREFAYTWPAQVSAIAPLAARLAAERDAALAEQKTDFAEALREFAGSDCTACANRSYAKDWAVVADLPRFLSLSASLYVYAGGAHGNGSFDDLVWDREAQAALKAADFFTSPAALQAALGAAWCAALKAERTERLGAEYADDEWFPCPDIAELSAALASSNGAAFDSIVLSAAPYVAGSYAEGGYEATLPVTPAVLAAVKAEYKGAFVLAK